MNLLLMGLKIIKKVQNFYDGDDNGYLREEINLLLMSLKIRKKVQDAYNGNGNRHLRKEMSPFTNKNRFN